MRRLTEEQLAELPPALAARTSGVLAHQDGADTPIGQAFQAVGVEDLVWTKAFRVTWPVDERLDLAPGLVVHRTGGHFPATPCCTTSGGESSSAVTR